MITDQTWIQIDRADSSTFSSDFSTPLSIWIEWLMRDLYSAGSISSSRRTCWDVVFASLRTRKGAARIIATAVECGFLSVIANFSCRKICDALSRYHFDGSWHFKAFYRCECWSFDGQSWDVRGVSLRKAEISRSQLVCVAWMGCVWHVHDPLLSSEYQMLDYKNNVHKAFRH